MRKLRAGLVNLSVMIGSILFLLLFCELVVFRFIWLASDAPRLDFVDSVIRYQPYQRGVWRFRNEFAAPYRINGQGWNSGRGDYAVERNTATRIAMVGDSYVEAFQVASTDSAAEVLERRLTQSGRPVEVYRFGISGAPLSQYVHMVEREVARYRPDWIVVLIVHNDFDESYRFVQGRYTSTFLKFRIEDGKVTGELPPTPWRAGAIETLRQTATARFFLYRWKVRPQAILDLFLPLPARAAENPWAANVDIGSILASRRDVAAAADHAVERLAALAGKIGARLLLVMDGDRQAIYRGDATSLALQLNNIMAEATSRHGVAFLDLHPRFAADWAAQHRRFEFAADGHWNELGHSVAGAAIAARITEATEARPGAGKPGRD